MKSDFSLSEWLSVNNFHLLQLETKILEEGLDSLEVDERVNLVELVSKELKIDFSEVDDSALLKFSKSLKIKVMKKDCTQAIYEGFVSTIGNDSIKYEFGLNEHDQGNFNSQINKMNLRVGLLMRGKITQEEYDSLSTVYWKTKNVGVIILTEDQFIQITDDAEYHVRSLQTKYWIIENQIKNAITCEQLREIKWNEKDDLNGEQ